MTTGPKMPRLLAALLVWIGMGVAARAELLVFVASSLTDVSTELAQAFEAETGMGVTLSFGSSSTLARQIAAGAQADAFLSANLEWIDFVQAEAGYDEGRVLFSNSLVIVAPQDLGQSVTIEELPEAVGNRRLALGDPAHVPAGQYARQALVSAGVWEALQPHLAPAENVRAALALVERGAAPFGIVYATDAVTGSVKVVGEIDPNLHAPVVYSLALPGAPSDDARAFAAFLSGQKAREIAADFGFLPPEGHE